MDEMKTATMSKMSSSKPDQLSANGMKVKTTSRNQSLAQDMTSNNDFSIDELLAGNKTEADVPLSDKSTVSVKKN